MLSSSEDPVADEEDFAAAAVRDVHRAARRPRARARRLLAHARACCARPRAAPRCGIPDEERVLGLIHLGYAKGPDKLAPERAAVDEIRSYLA